MNSLDDGLEGLRLDEQIFENVKFYVSGTVPEKVIELLKNGGAQRMIYFADYVTHLICGEDASETDLSDATDLYEVPAVVPKWVLMCVRLKKLVSVKPYVFAPTKLFTNLVFCFSKLDGDLNALWAIITYNGGLVQLTLDKGCTHLVTTSTLSPKYLKAFSMGAANIKIVTPDWVVESVKNKSLLDVDLYHPRLIQWPKVVKHESTTAITGFEPEQSELDPKPLETNATTDSTQALLDKLKQRMPWNQPQVATSATVTTVTEAPPNVVAPTYTGPKLVHDQQQRVLQQQPQPQPGALPASFTSQPSPNVAITTSQQIVRTVVHHTAQPRHFLPLQQQQQQNFNQQRFIQQRPLQQTTMRGQLPNQYPQQLLQQRPQQIGQPPVVTQLPQMAQQIQNQPPLNKPGLHQQVLLNRQMAQTQGQSFMQQLNQQKGVGGFQQLQQQNQQQFNPGPMQGQVLNQPQSDHFGGGSRQGFGQHINQHVQGGQQVQGQHGMQLQNQLQNQQLSGQQMQGGQLSGQQMQGGPLSGQQMQGGPLPGQQMQGGQLSGQQMQGGQLSGQQMQGGQPMQTQQIQGQPQLQGQQQMQNQLQNQQNHVPNQQIQGQLQNQLQNLQGQQIQNAQREQALQNQQMQQVQGIQNQQLQQNIQQNIQQQQQQQQAQSQQVQSQQQSQQGQSPLPNQQMQGQLQNQQQMQGQVQNQQMPNQQQQQQMQNQQNQQLIPNQQLHGQQFRNQLQGQQNQQLQGQQLQGQPQLQNQQMQPQQLMQGQLLQTQQLHPQQIAQPQLVQGQQQLQQLPPPPQNQQIFQQNPPQVLNQQLFTQPNQQNQPRQVNQHLWQQQQLGMRHPGGIVQQVQQPQGARIQWSPGQQAGLPQRQFIQLDAQTHQQLQQMAPEQRALFVAKIQQKQRQIFLQKQQLQQLQQQRGGHILIRGSVPPGLNQQQQMQWLQQQAKQQGIVLQSNLGQQPSVQQQQQQQQQPPPPTQVGLGQNVQHAPGLSPIQPNQQFGEQQQQQTQQQLLQRQFHLQQLQLQREQAQKTQQGLVQQPQQPQPAVLQQPQQQPVVRPLVATPAVDAVLPPAPTPTPGIDGANIPPQHPLVVNAKTKTALANMLSIRLQSGGSTIGPAPENMAAEPSAAGTLRLMTAQHNAALNSSARPQDLLGLQQRRAINGPNGELIRPVTPAVVPTPQAAEPPKLQYSPRAAAPIQHRPGPFYGHNPNLKLPPDLFLLGCVFVVVELERYLEESFPGWQQKIEKHGGEIERQYCSRVTHVLCETQRHGVVMQALRDYKRCVTLYWLSDVIKRKQVLPPWTALHLPTMYLDTTPASKHLISLSGFTGSERNRVKHMIKYTGATVTTYFTKHNTLLIASKPEGPKYLHAKKWGTPVVNVQWLTDVMLGNFTALNQMEHIKYQQFSNPPNFSFDPVLVPNLMHAWKMPINISQESYERVKRSASPVTVPKKPKKLKTEHATDENDNVDSRALQTSSHRVLFSMCSGVEDLKNIVKQLGGALALSHVDCTHLIMPQLARTNKLLHCICRGVHILPESWLRDSLTANKFLDESNYSLDTKDFNSEYRCDFTQTLATKNRNKLFEGKYFFVTPSVYPSKKMVVELIESCAGVVEKVRRTSAEIEATNMNSPYSYIILTQENDLHLVSDLLRNKKDKVRIVCNVELIFSAILKQTFEVEPYAVKVL